MPPIGRFAPTPSGPLHFGSLVAAIASYCQARSQQGQWLLRIEDVDTPRVVPGAADSIIQTLEQFGFEWDGQVSYQSDHFDWYEAALAQLQQVGLLYACQCSRRQLRKQGANQGPLGLVYPGNCRDRNLPGAEHAQRFNTLEAGAIAFEDGFYGDLTFNLAMQLGDPVLRRNDGIYAYHLAVVVDDEFEGITEIVRGADLLHTTCIHRYLQQSLGYRVPDYFHVPLVHNHAGDKLSKQTGAKALDPGKTGELMVQALNHLGQPTSAEMIHWNAQEILKAAIAHWDENAIRDKAGKDSAHLVDQ